MYFVASAQQRVQGRLWDRPGKESLSFVEGLWELGLVESRVSMRREGKASILNFPPCPVGQAVSVNSVSTLVDGELGKLRHRLVEL